MTVLTNIATLATCRLEGGQEQIHEIPDAALAWEGPTITWVGPQSDLPQTYKDGKQVDASRALVIPGLIDCHTHLAFGGWRADEFELRCRGAEYLEIARHGGGISSTVSATRRMAADEMKKKAEGFLVEMARLGVTTVECKSGYGLDVETELKILEVYRRLKEEQPVGIVPTFLGAHIVPPEYKSKRQEYVALLTETLIPAVALRGLADFCDVFVEDTAFTPEEARQIIETAKRYGLRVKLHVDQLNDGNGAKLAAELGAASANHLEYASEEGIRAMADAGVVAVTMPLASLYLNQPAFPARSFIDAGVPVAVATDFNPGSAPSYHLPLAMMLACTMSRMTPSEVLKGATACAALALGQADRIGSLEPGKDADFVLLNAPSINHWLYHFRPNDAIATYIKGNMFSV